MWEIQWRAPRGRLSTRKFITMIVTLLVTSLMYLTVATQPAHALPSTNHDANWNGQSLSYNAHDYSGPTTATANDPSSLPKGTVYYYTYGSSNVSHAKATDGYLIYFDNGVDPTKATRAHYVTANYDVASGIFSNLSPPNDISINASTYDSPSTINPSSCDVDGIGWIICPVSSWIAKGIDGIYSILADFLKVAPITGGNNGMYSMWQIIRNIANIVFIIGFLILIYAQMSGGLISNYTIKKMLPRIIIAAIMVNTSYWICAIAVDLSNILGASVQDFFIKIRESLGAANSSADDVTWQAVAAAALGGGALAIGGFTLAAATGLGAGAFGFLIIAALIPALFAVFVAVAILAARQALITVLIVLSPLAFVAYLLPNTEEWFTKWRKFFLSLLVMFPAYAVIFGGSQLTGILIIQNASNLFVVILGLLVQVVPLFITPFLIRLSSGMLGTIAGLANDKSKGAFDRAKNWANDGRELHKARAMKNGFNQNRRFKALRPTTYGARAANSKQHRENMTAAYNSQAQARYGKTRAGWRAYQQKEFGELENSNTAALNESRFQRKLIGDETSSSRIPLRAASEDRRYAGYQHMTHEAHEAHGTAEIIKGRVEAEGEREFREKIETAQDGTYYSALRAHTEATVVDTKHADSAKNTVQVSGEAEYDRVTRTNAGLQQRRLRETLAVSQADEAKQQWESLVKNIQATGMGTVSPELAVANLAIADAFRTSAIEAGIQGQIQQSAEIKQKANIVKAFTDNEDLRIRAAGVDDDLGPARVLATMKAERTKEMMTNTDNFQNTLPYNKASDNKWLVDAFNSLEKDDTVKQVAYARLLNKNGSDGVNKLRALLDDFTSNPENPPDADHVLNLKEIMNSSSEFRNNGRDFEVWSNNERKADGSLFTSFKDVANDTRTWNDITAHRFASMSKPNQIYALRELQRIDPDGLNGLVGRILADDTAMGNIKGVTQNMVKALANDANTDLAAMDVSNYGNPLV